ncbi:hypothetical protein [Rothia sp. ZJ932]|uniref:hypothetical protein n=1 Tax=Rothia sp. ZJ932 TaxID=2810516 RepID=UPI0019675C28|nr:hypothetical protein [Rothia sp. ZJ932]QRZ61812.1 hypothetical protein JR346_01320 [Rothia sp. ZJ932]
MNLKKISATALSVGALSLMSLGALAPAAQADTVPSSSFNSYTASNGLSSSYHIYDAGVDYSKNPGVVFYFDGDYWNTSQSKIWDPNNSDLIRMAQVANERNMVFVPVISPDQNAGGDGITWWEDADANGDFFRSLASSLIAEKGLNRSQVWTIGYSGGAEFQTFELAVDRQGSWRTGGGSIMVGGGGSNGLQSLAAASDLVMPMHWWVGQNDGEGVTWPATWSAYGAAHQGKAFFEGAGFTHTVMHVIPGVDHYGYDFPEILRASLDAAGVGVVEPAPVETVVPVEAGAPVPVETAPVEPAPVVTGAPAPVETGAPAPVETGAPAPVETKTPVVSESSAPTDASESVSSAQTAEQTTENNAAESSVSSAKSSVVETVTSEQGSTAEAQSETAAGAERRVLAKTGINTGSMLVALGVLLASGAVAVWASRARQA